MSFSKVLAIAILSLGSSLAFAQTINCEGFGELLDNGDQLIVTYQAGGQVQLANDVASFESMSARESVYLANRSGTRITITNALLEGKVAQDNVVLNVDGSDRTVLCRGE